MSILDYVSAAPSKAGVRTVISGVEGVGKSTLAANAPRALFVPLEQGAGGIVVHKTPMLESLEHTMSLLDEISAQAHARTFPFQSVVFDSATALERQIHDFTLRRDPQFVAGNKKAVTMESALGGYGKAYQYANELFHGFLSRCDTLAMTYGIHIVLTCHVFAAKIIDPTAGEYDSWDLLLHSPKNQKAYGKREMLTQWADVIGFLHEPLYVAKAGDAKSSFTMGVSANRGRVLGINRTPAYVAKNRYGVMADISVPKDGGWNYLADAIFKSSGVDVYNRD